MKSLAKQTNDTPILIDTYEHAYVEGIPMKTKKVPSIIKNCILGNENTINNMI